MQGLVLVYQDWFWIIPSTCISLLYCNSLLRIESSSKDFTRLLLQLLIPVPIWIVPDSHKDVMHNRDY